MDITNPEVSFTAPQFLRTLTGIGIKGITGQTEDAAPFAELQVGRIGPTYDPNILNTTVPDSTKSVELKFQDGTSVNAKVAFLNMLPYDLPAISGMAPWSKALDKYTSPDLATKIVLGWNDESQAPAKMFGVRSCIDPDGCQRMIFSGNNDDPNDPWMIRQFWIWDQNTISKFESERMA